MYRGEIRFHFPELTLDQSGCLLSTIISCLVIPIREADSARFGLAASATWRHSESRADSVRNTGFLWLNGIDRRPKKSYDASHVSR